jgi:hypothetical protein
MESFGNSESGPKVPAFQDSNRSHCQPASSPYQRQLLLRTQRKIDSPEKLLHHMTYRTLDRGFYHRKPRLRDSAINRTAEPLQNYEMRSTCTAVP